MKVIDHIVPFQIIASNMHQNKWFQIFQKFSGEGLTEPPSPRFSTFALSPGCPGRFASSTRCQYSGASAPSIFALNFQLGTLVWPSQNEWIRPFARFQRLFSNPGGLMSGRTSAHQNLVSLFPGIDNCLKTKWLKDGCLPYAVGKQLFIPLISLGRKWTLK